MLAIRRTLFNLHDLPDMEATAWLQFSKMSRAVRNFSTAADAANRSEALGSPYARIEQAKLLMATGQVSPRPFFVMFTMWPGQVISSCFTGATRAAGC